MSDEPRTPERDAPHHAGDYAGDQPRPRGLRAIPLWAWGAIVASVALMALGLALPRLADTRNTVAVAPDGRVLAMVEETQPDGSARTRSGDLIVGGFLPPSSDAGRDPDTPDPRGTPVTLEERDIVSPAVFRAGFSFFVGFAVAFALRQFVKFSIVALGLFFLAMFGLQYAGLIEVKWAVMEDRYHAAGGWLGGQVESFKAFLTGYLPSAALATAGLAAGFTRK